MGRILVIRGGAIGDFILTLPALGLLRENFPNAWIEILGYRHIVALAEGRFYANASRSIEYAAMSRFFVPNAELDPELMEYFGGFHQIISYLFDPDGFFEANLRRCGVKNFLHASPKINDSDHAAKQLARPLEQLALFLDNPGPQLHPNEEDHQRALDFFGGLEGPRLVAIHPGSGSEKKNWPIEHWLELVRRIVGWSSEIRIIVCAGEAEGERCRALLAATDRALAADSLDLPVLAAVLRRAGLFIGHDSGISHLAAAVGTPSVLLFGPTDPEIWAPANAGVSVLLAERGDLRELSVDVVERMALEKWSATPN